ncbi:chromate transporter [Pseudobacter ginsenosidimutans]|uniref:Chromate transporter n=1 Tax=Pseudobacter ginsenosidimutans TaxID=661488 RepID=A0A4Q7MQR7_9BACT|nr:chromate transporter [Pseudobacter ginsenosidimutans]QEC42095.1 chromate transporter [Pseudobacter ginsenosidimutans]RZS71065.1 chromate transporter [Pseudobacter ginsenosidimutans]
MSDKAIIPYSLKSLVLYFLKLGATGFGGPVALVGYMHRDLVDKRKWISEDDYREGLALAQLAPGPLAAQLGIYIGFVHYRLLGATLAGLAFVLPSFIIVLALGIAYKYYQGISWMQAVFYGVGAAVIGIIAVSAWKLTKKSTGKDPYRWFIYLVAAITTIITENENVLLFIAAGIFYWLVKSAGSLKKKAGASAQFFIPVLLQIDTGTTQAGKLQDIFLFFIKAGAFVFGSGLAIVPFLYGGVVKEYGWLNEQEFMDAVAVAMITPGPVVITVGFIGYLTAGFSGASVAAFATFFPCYLFTVIPAPYFKKYGKRPGIKAFVDGITAAAIGAIAGAVIVLGKRSISDLPTILICAITIAILVLSKKITEQIIILAAALAGLIIKIIQPS